jgi:hypothetical protein
LFDITERVDGCRLIGGLKCGVMGKIGVRDSHRRHRVALRLLSPENASHGRAKAEAAWISWCINSRINRSGGIRGSGGIRVGLRFAAGYRIASYTDTGADTHSSSSIRGCVRTNLAANARRSFRSVGRISTGTRTSAVIATIIAIVMQALTALEMADILFTVLLGIAGDTARCVLPRDAQGRANGAATGA